MSKDRIVDIYRSAVRLLPAETGLRTHAWKSVCALEGSIDMLIEVQQSLEAQIAGPVLCETCHGPLGYSHDCQECQALEGGEAA